MSDLTKTYVLYHAGCLDGFTAAWVVWRDLGDEGVEYIPVSYQEPPPETERGARVIIVDFSYPRNILEAMAEEREVLVLDHHKTAQEALSGLNTDPESSQNLCVLFGMDQSGAGLAWGWFNPRTRPPRLVKYVEDRDLWRWSLPDSKAINAYIGAQDQTFESWSRLCQRLEERLEEVIEAGYSVLAHIDQQVERICSHGRLVLMGPVTGPGLDYKVAIANSAVYQSEVGHRLLEMFPEADFAAVRYLVEEAGQVEKWSFRARKGGFDVSTFARQYGGGGHPAAAGLAVASGFRQSRQGFNWMPIIRADEPARTS